MTIKWHLAGEREAVMPGPKYGIEYRLLWIRVEMAEEVSACSRKIRIVWANTIEFSPYFSYFPY
ncbi:hypothetical protein RRH01S_14_00140 [Rhizobium rhizogenes NBRC 13257]|uniref:Uncharacterized protein n=1 Tax=Rhizobium rhizogenes NBRC 13257 TaxID=1220581 RepID=A0AA87QFA3_RHIRH|nr:hypothetical protein RRH01S_14_00140 [Rhizobium rhizogenes NBRC 13257]